MHVDLLTLYFLAIGTLLACAGMTLWEGRSHSQRRTELRILASGYAVLATGCALAILRHDLPGAWGSAISNLVIVSGYLLITNGIAVFKGRHYRLRSIAVLLATALTWSVLGGRWQNEMWMYVSDFPIVLASAWAAGTILSRDGKTFGPSGRVIGVVTGVHGVFYAVRTFLLPGLVALYGIPLLNVAGQITMYEGVLYSVILPMTLLKLVREETHGQLLREAQTDYLTRLGNRRWFFEEGSRIVSDSRSGRPLSLLVFDLDYFKAINDQYGHKAGDDVLRAFADTARDVVGADAILARIGGEEFAALLPGCDSAHAKGIGETIARQFAGTIAHSRNGLDIQATVSVGLAQLDIGATSLADFLAAADQALYSAKSLGRNRLELAVPATQRAVA